MDKTLTIPKTTEILRIYTLEHGKDMTPDELDAHSAAIIGLNTLSIVCHQFKLMAQALENERGKAWQIMPDMPKGPGKAAS